MSILSSISTNHSLMLVTEQQAGKYQQVKDFCQKTYERKLGITTTLPSRNLYIAATSSNQAGGEITAAIGISFPCYERPHFSEMHLETPLSTYLASFNIHVDSASVIEIGSLASTRNGLPAVLLCAAPTVGWMLGYKYAIATLTERLIDTATIESGWDFRVMKCAIPDDSFVSVNEWGRYYGFHPYVGYLCLESYANYTRHHHNRNNYIFGTIG